MLPVRAITFDVGGTLIEPRTPVGHVYAGVARDFGVDGLAPETLTANFVRAWKARPRFDYSRAGWYEIVRESFGRRGDKLPPAFYPAVYERFGEAEVWRVFDDVLPALEELRRQGVKLGVISNWDERLRPLLARLNLGRWFQRIVVSCEAGAAKPDARLFRRAAAGLGVRPGELLHVGDDWELDVCGAESAGCQGRMVRRRPGACAPGELRTLMELCAAPQ